MGIEGKKRKYYQARLRWHGQIPGLLLQKLVVNIYLQKVTLLLRVSMIEKYKLSFSICS